LPSGAKSRILESDDEQAVSLVRLAYPLVPDLGSMTSWDLPTMEGVLLKE